MKISYRPTYSVKQWWLHPNYMYDNSLEYLTNFCPPIMKYRVLVNIYSVIYLLKLLIQYKIARKWAIEDNILIPYYKYIGCKFFKHRYTKRYSIMICSKCGHRLTTKNDIRIEKLKGILK